MTKKRVAITKLKVGDFVDSVSKQLGDVHIVQNGLVKSQFALNNLKKKGVIEVVVDSARSDLQQDNTQTRPQQKHKPIKKYNFKQALTLCQPFYYELLECIELNIERATAQQPLDILALERIAQHCFELVQQHHHCLASIIRSKHDDNTLVSHSMRLAVCLAQFCDYSQQSKETARDVILAAILSPFGRLLLTKELRAVTSSLPPLLQHKKQSHIDLCLRLIAMSCNPAQLTLRLISHQAQRLDGSGYPKGLSYDDATELDKIFILAIEYDALIYGFDHSKALGSTHVLRHLMECSPAQFDSDSMTLFIKAIGVYPTGSIVKLKSQRLAIVLENNHDSATKPLVRIFYNAEFSHHIKKIDIDLCNVDDEIESTVKRQKYDVEIQNLICD